MFSTFLFTHSSLSWQKWKDEMYRVTLFSTTLIHILDKKEEILCINSPFQWRNIVKKTSPQIFLLLNHYFNFFHYSLYYYLQRNQIAIKVLIQHQYLKSCDKFCKTLGSYLHNFPPSNAHHVENCHGNDSIKIYTYIWCKFYLSFCERK